VEGMKNYLARDLVEYDDFAPVYERLNLDGKTRIIDLHFAINNEPFWKKLWVKWIESPYFRR
jgi:hypothetical protein